MKNLKVKLLLLALVMGFGGALATSAHGSFTTKTWGRLSTGSYIDVTALHEGTQYSCDPGAGVCTAVYPDTQNPNSDPLNPISTVPGVFSN